MKNLALIFVGLVCLILASCGSKSGDSENASSNKINYLFDDMSVTSFQQTSGIAKNTSILNYLFNFAFPTATAISYNISCYAGSNPTFMLNALGHPLVFSVECNDDIDRQIRSNLLESMEGLTIKRFVSDASYKDGAIDFRSGIQWDTPYSVKAQEDANDDHTADDACYENYTFHKESSTITIGFDAVRSHANCYCSNNTCNDTEVAFRFYNGTLELDLSNRGLFDQNLGRHAITGNYCTTALTDPNCESFYEQWRNCTIGNNCSL
jgi:hypothetical protein